MSVLLLLLIANLAIQFVGLCVFMFGLCISLGWEWTDATDATSHVHSWIMRHHPSTSPTSKQDILPYFNVFIIQHLFIVIMHLSAVLCPFVIILYVAVLCLFEIMLRVFWEAGWGMSFEVVVPVFAVK